MAWENPIYKLSENTLDFVALQFKTIAESWFGIDFDEDTTIPRFEYYSSRGVGIARSSSAVWGNGARLFTCNINFNNVQDSYLYSDISFMDYDDISSVGGTVGAQLKNRNGSYPEISWWLDNYVKDNYYIYNHNAVIQSNQLANVNITIPYSSLNNTMNVSTVSLSPFTLSSPISNVPFPPNNNYGTWVLPLGNVSPVQSLYPPSDYSTVIYNGVTYNYGYSNSGGLYFEPTSDFSFGDMEAVMNNTIIPFLVGLADLDPSLTIQPNLKFPSFSDPVPPPFAYIEPIRELDYSLEMPDTSDYLDVQSISKPLSICSDSLSYMWNAITSLGLAPVLGFCLVATLVIKGLRGD